MLTLPLALDTVSASFSGDLRAVQIFLGHGTLNLTLEWDISRSILITTAERAVDETGGGLCGAFLVAGTELVPRVEHVGDRNVSAMTHFIDSWIAVAYVEYLSDSNIYGSICIEFSYVDIAGTSIELDSCI